MVKRGENEHGPVSSGQLRNLASSGKLRPNDLVRHGENDAWKEAASVAGLFAAEKEVLVQDDGFVQAELSSSEEFDSSGSNDAPSNQKPNSPVALDWYYAKGQERMVPVSWDELCKLATSGQLVTGDLVWSEGMPEWSRADHVAGLFPPKGSNAPPPLPTSPAIPPIPQKHEPAEVRSAGHAIWDGGKRFFAGSQTEEELTEVTQPTKSTSRTAVLVLTIIGAFVSFFVGGCTSATFEGLANTCEGLNEWSDDFDRRFGQYSSRYDTRSKRVDTETIRKSGQSYVLLGFLEAALGLAGGFVAYRSFGTTLGFSLLTIPIRKVTLAGLVILFAALLSISNTFTFITAGILKGVAAVLCLLNKPEPSP
ncbi:hypothetical protein Pla8534_18370 [Lignipirellula cremea]|uniref:GYF domain-containing protein n=2 Tax=Lignipirellula cremea TaxID=2528010 RepID=A0A518DQD7_9BACT|nr:hypothetical protein Pla8534_18370 [Lignipirellula cremea]